MTQLAPIILFVYNRPQKTMAVVDALKQNFHSSNSELIIFSDGPKADAAQQQVKRVRHYIQTIKGLKDVVIVKRDKNYGLSRSIITGVTEIIEAYGKAIVLEDDIVTSPYFLRYMNDSLDYYENDEKVASIGAYTYYVKGKLPETFFLRCADCWGWATWKRGWDLFDCNGEKLLAELKKKDLCRRFDFDGTYPCEEILKDQINGKNDSWAIRWYASVFLAEKLTLYPGRSLVSNIGTDSSGVHCDTGSRFDVTVSEHHIAVDNIDVVESVDAHRKISQFFKRNIAVRLFSRIKRAVRL